MKVKIKLSKNLKNWYGTWDEEKKTITISLIKNKKISDFVDTFYHELLHALYPDLTENQVSKKAKKLAKKKKLQLLALKTLFLASIKKNFSFDTSNFKPL